MTTTSNPSARWSLDPAHFGITWNAALELGGVLVGDEVTIHIEASLVRSQAAAAA